MEIGGQLQDPPPPQVDDGSITMIPNDVAHTQQLEVAAFEPPHPPMPYNIQGALPNTFDSPLVHIISEEVSVKAKKPHTPSTVGLALYSKTHFVCDSHLSRLKGRQNQHH